jgi:hypothetical protein
MRGAGQEGPGSRPGPLTSIRRLCGGYAPHSDRRRGLIHILIGGKETIFASLIEQELSRRIP